MSLDRDFEEAEAWLDLVTADSGVSVEALSDYLLDAGPDPNPFAHCDDPAGRSFVAMLDVGVP